VISIFPEFFAGPLDISLVGKALASGAITVEVHDLREHGDGVHRSIDDAPSAVGRAWS